MERPSPSSPGSNHHTPSPSTSTIGKQRFRKALARPSSLHHHNHSQLKAKHQQSAPVTTPHPYDQFLTHQLVLSSPRDGTESRDIAADSQTPLKGHQSSDQMSVNEYFGEQTLSLARAIRRSSFAKEHMAIKHLQEMELYREAVRSEAEGNRSLPYRAQQAVSLASAVRETLAAKKAYLDRRVEEAALRLKARRDKADEVEGKLAMADRQLSALTRAMRSQNLGRDWAAGGDVYRFRPREYHQERWPYANALDNESGSASDDSGLESFYEAPDGHVTDDSDV